MSPSIKYAVRNSIIILGAAAVVGGCYQGMLQILRTDALAKYRGNPSKSALDDGIIIKDFEFSSYQGDRLVAKAKVSEVKVRRDRSIVDMFAVTDGKYYASNGESFAFSGSRATYGYYSRALAADTGARIRNKDLDLNVPAFTYVEARRTLTVPGMITGQFYGGKIEAENLNYNVEKRSYTTGKISWEGQATAPTAQPQKRLWKITGGDSENENNVMTVKNARATDGEVIIKADLVVWNRETDVLTATGNVRYFGIEANMTCAKVVVYRAESRAVMTGKVNMFVKAEANHKLEEVEIPPLTPIVPDDIAKNRPKAPGQSADKKADDELRSSESMRKYPATIIGEKVEYWYKKGSRRAVISGSPQARQELLNGRWRMAWAYVAYYDGEKEWLKMTSREGKKDARFMTSLGDDIFATDFEASTKQGVDKWNAKNMDGDIYADPDDDNPPTGGGSSGGTSTPPSIRGPIGSGRA